MRKKKQRIATGVVCRIPVGDWNLELEIKKKQVHDPRCNEFAGWSWTRCSYWWLEHDGYRTEVSSTTATALILARAVGHFINTDNGQVLALLRKIGVEI